MYYTNEISFLHLLGISIAKASFWLLIMGGIGLTLWFLFRSVVNFLIEDAKGIKDKWNKQE